MKPLSRTRAIMINYWISANLISLILNFNLTLYSLEKGQKKKKSFISCVPTNEQLRTREAPKRFFNPITNHRRHHYFVHCIRCGLSFHVLHPRPTRRPIVSAQKSSTHWFIHRTQLFIIQLSFLSTHWLSPTSS